MECGNDVRSSWRTMLYWSDKKKISAMWFVRCWDIVFISIHLDMIAAGFMLRFRVSKTTNIFMQSALYLVEKRSLSSWCKCALNGVTNLFWITFLRFGNWYKLELIWHFISIRKLIYLEIFKSFHKFSHLTRIKVLFHPEKSIVEYWRTFFSGIHF